GRHRFAHGAGLECNQSESLDVPTNRDVRHHDEVAAVVERPFRGLRYLAHHPQMRLNAGRTHSIGDRLVFRPFAGDDQDKFRKAEAKCWHHLTYEPRCTLANNKTTDVCDNRITLDWQGLKLGRRKRDTDRNNLDEVLP